MQVGRCVWMVWTRWKPECGHGKCQADVLQIATMYVIIIIIAVTILIITTNTINLVIFMVSNFINYLIIVIIINLRAMLAMQ